MILIVENKSRVTVAISLQYQCEEGALITLIYTQNKISV